MFSPIQSTFGFILLLVVGASAAPEADRVLSLPGLEGPEPTFNHYAGYLNATNGKHFFYW
jgi:hypothetical protein